MTILLLIIEIINSHFEWFLWSDNGIKNVPNLPAGRSRSILVISSRYNYDKKTAKTYTTIHFKLT